MEEQQGEPVKSRGREGGAEAVLNLQPNSSISIGYHSLFGPHEDLLLLELENNLLPHVLNNRVTIRGEPDEDAVLCTPSTTYALKFVGTSNSMFLVPPSDPSPLDDNGVSDLKVASVLKVAPGHMELVEVAPRLEKLKSLLMENPYKPDEDFMEEDVEEMEKNDNFGLYRWDDLIDKVQASDEELREALRCFSAVEINGFWRIVDENYMDMILNMLVHNSVLNGWSFDALEEGEVVRMMKSKGFPCEIARHCLEVYANKVEEEVGGSQLWRLNEKRVCVHFARGVLSGGKMKMETFMEKWMQKLPVRLIADFDMLEGELLVERLGVEMWVRAFSVSSLPLTPAERFAALFRERQKWDGKDLQPYIRDLRVPGLSSEGLLLKYTRRTQPTANAEPIFSAR